ncbi:MAG: NAD(P)H-dependent oxidoreductase [Bacteroidota bacterium]
MPSTLLLFAHPALEKSRINRELLRGIKEVPNLTFHDLYEHYPDFYIDVQHEQELLLQHEIIIWQHPLYWYSTPPLLKQWIDLTLQHDWAYGSRGVFLRGKKVLSVITSGASRESYAPGQFNRRDLNDYLLPLRRTAELCGMKYLPPYLINGTHAMTEPDIQTTRTEYLRFLGRLQSGDIPETAWAEVAYANDLPVPQNS